MSDEVRAHIAAILEDDEFSMHGYSKNETYQEAANHVLGLNSPEFDVFSSALVEHLTRKQSQEEYVRMWSKFHAVRCSSEVTATWTELLSSLGMCQKFTTDPLLQQYVNDSVFESIYV